MKEIKIVDFGNEAFEDNFLIRILGERFQVVESDTGRGSRTGNIAIIRT